MLHKGTNDMRKIERIFVHCTASNQSWGGKELWAESSDIKITVKKV